MEPEVFSSDAGPNAQAAFQIWQADHPNGLCLNLKTTASGMMHRVGCGHIGGAGEWIPEFGDLARRAKVCHPDSATLMEWAERNGIIEVKRCADCRP